MTALNKAITEWDGQHGLPRFEAIRDEDFRAAFDHAMQAHLADIDAIARSTAPATFESVIVPLELAGEPLSRVNALFWNRAGADTNDAIKALEREISPACRATGRRLRRTASCSSASTPYGRAMTAGRWAKRPSASLRITGRASSRPAPNSTRPGRSGLRRSTRSLPASAPQFGQNVLADESTWAHDPDRAGRDCRPAGIPAFGNGRSRARPWRRCKVGPSRFRARSSSRSSPSRSAATCARPPSAPGSRAAKARTTTARSSPKILKLRNEKARMLGYENYAALKLDDTMAKTSSAVEGLLKPVWEKALERAEAETAELSAIIAAEGRNHAVEPWDWRHYAEKLRQQKFAFSESELKPYLQLERIIDASFAVANRLFGISFRPRPDIAGLAPRRARLRGAGSRRQCGGHVLRRLFQPAVKAVRRLDERVPVAASPRWRTHSGHLQHHELRQGARRQAGAAVAGRGKDAVPRIRPCACTACCRM